MTNVADSAGNSTTNWFNNQGMVCIVSNALGCQRMTKYDMEDHAIQTVDANTVTNTFCYDDLGRRICVTNGLNTIATYTYSLSALSRRRTK